MVMFSILKLMKASHEITYAICSMQQNLLWYGKILKCSAQSKADKLSRLTKTILKLAT